MSQEMTVRHATERDMPCLLRMGMKFVAHSPYGRLAEPNAVALTELFQGMINGDGRCLLINDTGTAMLGGLVSPAFFNPIISCAAELFLWSEGGRQAGKLIEAFEVWARSTGATCCSLTQLVGEGQSDPSKFYREAGFELNESSYLKVL